ncbi:hypothetical protein CSX02_13175 [Agathobacter ruminis]|uniref:HTH araC/xylS-type domain-containing protein n=2 Tax=Agathobacter ruminis TaxID=1712665 RepID=A0A2G3DYW9_9FIRM|nr:hypothetical protein CSX02_13175 [Agathobacter ruminis]
MTRYNQTILVMGKELFMSFISLEKPVQEIEIYKLDKPLSYRHQDFTILLLLDGQALIRNTYFLPEDLLLLPPGVEISIQPISQVVLAVIRLNNYLLLSSLDHFTVFSSIHDSPTNVRLKECIGSLENLIRSYRTGLVSHYYFQFIDDLMRIFPAEDHMPDQELTNSTNEQILQYIHENLLQNISLNHAAASVHLTPQYLASFFQKKYGCTFKDYVNAQKATLCLPLLQYTSFSEEALAGLLGFHSALSMNKALQKSYGKNAKQIRNESLLPCEILPFPEENRLSNFDRYLSNAVHQAQKTESNQIANIQEYSTSYSTDFGQMPNSWRQILNIGRCANMENPQFRNQLISLQHEINFRYARIIDLFDEMTIHEINGQIFYVFEEIFQVLDLFLSLNLIPMIVLGNHYRHIGHGTGDNYLINSSENYQSYYKKLQRVLPVFIRTCHNRYGLREVSRWHFEVCYDFANRSSSRQTPWQFLTTYQKIEGIIHEYVPDCKVGGPGYQSILPLSEFEGILKNIQKEQIRFDFISFFVYGNKDLSPDSGIMPTGSILVDRARESTLLVRKYFRDIPLYMTEFGPFYNKRNFLNDSVFLACTLSWFMTTHLESVDALGYCLFSDISTEYADSRGLLFGGSGIFTYLGIRKPSYYVFHFLNQLGTQMVSTHPGLIMTSSSKFSYQLLLYHCPGLTLEATASRHCKELFESDEFVFEPLAPKQLNISLTQMVPGRYLVKSYRLNQHSGNLLHEFSKIRDVTDLAQTDIDCLQALSIPHAELEALQVKEDGILSLSPTIQSLEVIFIQIDYNYKVEKAYEL